MDNILMLKKDSVVKTKDNREFTRLLGGFGENNPMFTIWQAGELLGISTREVYQNYDRNIGNFEDNVDLINLKSAITENDSENKANITVFLKEIGYSQSKLNATKQWLAFSFSGMLKLVKIVTTKESWDIYDNFLEDYFQTKAENIVMKKTITEEIDEIKKSKAFLLGMAIMEDDEVKRIEMLREIENFNRRILELEKSLTREETLKQIEHKLYIADKITDDNLSYDVGNFSKVLGIKNFGRNKLFEWLRNKNMLRSTNEPFQTHMEYFKVIPIVRANGFKDSKTLIKGNGVNYIVKKLIKDGKIISKPIEQIIEELNSIE